MKLIIIALIIILVALVITVILINKKSNTNSNLNPIPTQNLQPIPSDYLLYGGYITKPIPVQYITYVDMIKQNVFMSVFQTTTGQTYLTMISQDNSQVRYTTANSTDQPNLIFNLLNWNSGYNIADGYFKILPKNYSSLPNLPSFTPIQPYIPTQKPPCINKGDSVYLLNNNLYLSLPSLWSKTNGPMNPISNSVPPINYGIFKWNGDGMTNSDPCSLGSGSTVYIGANSSGKYIFGSQSEAIKQTGNASPIILQNDLQTVQIFNGPSNNSPCLNKGDPVYSCGDTVFINPLSADLYSTNINLNDPSQSRNCSVPSVVNWEGNSNPCSLSATSSVYLCNNNVYDSPTSECGSSSSKYWGPY